MTHTDDRPPIVDDPPQPWDDYDPGPPPPARQNGRTPPQDVSAERAALGAMLNSTDAIADVTAIITGADFYNPAHEQIHDAILALHAADQPVDMVTVGAELARRHDHRGRSQLELVGGAPYLHTLYSAALDTAGNAGHYAQIIRDHARLRDAIDVGTKIAQLGYTGDISRVDAIMGDAVQTLDEAAFRHSGLSTHTPTTWSPVDLAQVLAGEYLDPPPTMLRRSDGIPLLYDGAVHTISGESESGKTWLTLLATVQLLSDGLPVVFIDFEDRADRVIGRLLGLGATPTQVQELFSYIRPDRPLDDHGRAQLTPALTKAALVILDGVTEAMTMHGYDLNSNADSALFQGLLPRWIADHGPAVAMIDHVVKDKEKQDRFALGAQHKLAGIDGVAYIVKMVQPFARGKRGLARVEIAKDRPGHVREHAFGKTIAEFTLDATGSEVVLIAHLMPPGEASGREGQPFEPTYLMEKISRYVEVSPGLSKKAIEDLVNGKAATKRAALELLVTRGYIGQTRKGAGFVHHHVKPYRQDDEDPDETGPDQPLDTPTQEAS